MKRRRRNAAPFLFGPVFWLIREIGHPHMTSALFLS
jgi:hypothetical protein